MVLSWLRQLLQVETRSSEHSTEGADSGPEARPVARVAALSVLRLRRRLSLEALALPVAAALGGCVVAPYGTYFRPSSPDPDATIKGAWCQGEAGPTTNIELALGDGHMLRFERIDIVFRDGVALDALLHVNRAAGAGATEVQIEVLLPGGVPDFEVHLPALRVGTAMREIAPIRFERRRFDGGIEPFNC
jgi:hypothetical protein